jgi:HKD family nuclease
MKTAIKTLGVLAITVASLFTNTSCSKNKEEKQIEVAIEKRAGTYTADGTNINGPYTDETITVLKEGKTKVTITGSILPKTYLFEVKNGSNVSGGSVSGNADGTAIGYVGSNGLTFSISESGAIALVDPSNSFTLAGTKK